MSQTIVELILRSRDSSGFIGGILVALFFGGIFWWTGFCECHEDRELAENPFIDERHRRQIIDKWERRTDIGLHIIEFTFFSLIGLLIVL